VVDARYFAVATLTTSSMTAPDLVLEHDWMKLFTSSTCCSASESLVEILRRLGSAFVSVRASDDKAKDATRGGSAEGRGQRRNRMKAPRSAETIVIHEGAGRVKADVTGLGW
jgi:hypothetical protein